MQMKWDDIMFKPQRLGTVTLPDDELTADKKTCRKIGPCGVGKKAIYLNSFYFDRRYYIPISSIERIFKRIAMSIKKLQKKLIYHLHNYYEKLNRIFLL